MMLSEVTDKGIVMAVINQIKTNRKWMYILLCAVIFIWGLDYSIAKDALNILDPLSLLFFKYVISLALILIIRLIAERGPIIRLNDVWKFVVCAVLGDIAYYYGEYSAMSYMPVSLITLVLTFVPAVSILIEWILYRRKPGKKVIIGIFVCIFGVSLIIGIDWSILLQGRIIGYLLAFSCVFCWNIYNFMTANLHKRYTTLSLTLNQLICTCLLLLPYVIHFAPPLAEFTPVLVWELLYLGLISSSIGFLVFVRALYILGPTPAALFSNFLPITTTLFGWLILGEVIAPIQLAGGAILIGAGYAVIKELGKEKEKNEINKI